MTRDYSRVRSIASGWPNSSGGVSIRTISSDLAQLEKRGVIARFGTPVGKTSTYSADGAKTTARTTKPGTSIVCTSERKKASRQTSQPKRFLQEEENFPSEVQQTTPSDVQLPARKNKKKREQNREELEDSKDSLQKIVEARSTLASYVEDFAREFKDDAPMSSSITRMMNLYIASGLAIGEFIAVLMAARQTTQRRTS